MKTDSILQADVLDIIFENRNKAYGAYALRKYYNSRLYKAMGITFFAAAIICAFSFFQKHPVENILIVEDHEFRNPPANKDIKAKNPAEKQKAEKPATPKVKAAMQVLPNSFRITLDTNVTEMPDFIEGVAIGRETVSGLAGNGVPVTPNNNEGNAATLNPDVSTVPVDNATPLNTAEVMPAYPGGMDALRKFLEKNLTNPQDLSEGETISVKIKFVVGYDGKLKGFQIAQDGGSAFNEEVIRVLKKMPYWIPGKTKGENVSVYFTIPVKFTTSE